MMKFSLWTNYGALNSKPVFDAFAYSCLDAGHTVGYNDKGSDVDVIWSVLWHGRMANNRTIWEQAQQNKKPIIVLEVGGLQRNITWKVGLNGINRDAYFGPKGNDDTRAKKLGLTCKPWKNNENGPIVIACQHAYSHQWKNKKPIPTWVYDTATEIRDYTDRQIIIRPHPRCRIQGIEHYVKDVVLQYPKKLIGTYDDFDFHVDDAYAIVNWSSNPATHAIMNGIPAFVGPSSLAYDVANIDLKDINNPIKPDRTQWLNDLAHTEWTVEEIKQGIPLKSLTSCL